MGDTSPKGAPLTIFLFDFGLGSDHLVLLHAPHCCPVTPPEMMGPLHHGLEHSKL